MLKTHYVELSSRLKKACELLKNHRNDDVLIVSHIDADGLASGAILSQTLDRFGVEHEVMCVKLNELPNVEPKDLTIFSDLGSGQLHLLSKFKDEEFVVLDHHPSSEENFKNLVHVNPCLFGFDGSREISGAGVSYLFAKKLDKENSDLSAIAVVGASGDMQDFGKLQGLNRSILEEGIEMGVMEVCEDLLLYGRYTRPLYKSLQFFSDPYLPGITGSERGAISLLERLGIEVKNDDWRMLSDLSHAEKKRLATELIKRAIHSTPKDLVSFVPNLIFGEAYTLLREEVKTPLRDAQEFSTCLNAAGRNGKFDVGIEVCKGNRGIYYEVLIGLLRKHRKMIVNAIELALEREIKKMKNIQVFDARGIPDTLVGTVASMILGQDNVEPYIPILGYTETENEDVLKISVRCSRLLMFRGINLGKAVKIASRKVGGEGGGHKPAAGAFVPREKFFKFLEILDRVVW